MSEAKRIAGSPGAARFSLVLAVVLGIVAWRFLGRITDAGLERLARIDDVRTWCDVRYKDALTQDDTLRVDRLALPDTIDATSSDAIDRCGDLRPRGESERQPDARELTGEEMPRGLR